MLPKIITHNPSKQHKIDSQCEYELPYTWSFSCVSQLVERRSSTRPTQPFILRLVGCVSQLVERRSSTRPTQPFILRLVGCLAQLVERRSSAGVLSLSYARLAAEGWPFMFVNRPLQVSQLGQLILKCVHWNLTVMLK